MNMIIILKNGGRWRWGPFVNFDDVNTNAFFVNRCTICFLCLEPEVFIYLFFIYKNKILF